MTGNIGIDAIEYKEAVILCVIFPQISFTLCPNIVPPGVQLLQNQSLGILNQQPCNSHQVMLNVCKGGIKLVGRS